MARIRVKLNYSGLRSLLNDAGVRSMLTAKADRVASAARASAPRQTGEYAASIGVVQDSTDRVAVRVVARAPHGMVVEANTGNLSRALGAAGARRA